MARVRAADLYLDVAWMLANAAAHEANEGRKREKTQRRLLSPLARIRALVHRARVEGRVYALTQFVRVCESLAEREERDLELGMEAALKAALEASRERRELVLDDETPVREVRAEDLEFDDTTDVTALG